MLQLPRGNDPTLQSIPFMTFRNQVILITGGSSGIGLATARHLARQGAHVWLVARTPERLADALPQVQAACDCSDQRCGVIPADVADPEQAAFAVAEVTRLAGLPDILINSHGIARPGYFQDLDLAVFREMMDTNYFGALHTIRAVIPGMIARQVRTHRQRIVWAPHCWRHSATLLIVLPSTHCVVSPTC